MTWETSLCCCVMHIRAASAKEIACYLYRQMIGASSTSHSYPRVSRNDRLSCNVWFQWLPKDFRHLSEMQPMLYIFLIYNLINLIAIHQEKPCLWTNGWAPKWFMYLIETGFNLVSLDQPLEFFIYLNEILRVVTYIYVVKVPLYWTQKLRLPFNRILNKIIN